MIQLELVDKSVFELLRLKFVSLGYLPNITSFSNKTQFESAKTAIIENFGFFIDIFGVGTSESRDDKKNGKILIDRGPFNVGDIGSFGVIEYSKDSDKYRKEKLPNNTFDISYNIRTICNSTKQERLMLSTLFEIFQNHSFLNLLNSDKHLLQFNGYSNLSQGTFLESIFKITIKDVYLLDNTILENNISELKEVHSNIRSISNIATALPSHNPNNSSGFEVNIS